MMKALGKFLDWNRMTQSTSVQRFGILWPYTFGKFPRVTSQI